MKLIQLGGANDALCHFLSVGGFELLLDCGVSLSLSSSSSAPLLVRLPALEAVDVASLDAVLLSNHVSLLALPFLTHTLGFQGAVYATEMAVRFGRVLLEELHAQAAPVVFELASSSTSPPAPPTLLPPVSLQAIASCLDDVTIVEYKEITRLAYGVSLTALSAGFSLGASVWLLESPSDRIAYVATASGDLNRHPKELDFAPLIDCDTLIVTDIKPDRDPHATTEHTVERLLSAVSRVVDRGGVCILPVAFAGVLLDLVEAVHAACLQNNKTTLPIVLLSPATDDVLDLAQCGAEFLCEKKVEKLYAGEPAFTHELLRKNKVLQVAATLTSQVVSSLQHGGVVFVSHPTLRLGQSADVVRAFGGDARNAVVLTDPSYDPHDVLSPFYSLQIEKMVCPIDARLSCGDVNQFIARCCPRNLIVPHEYLVAVSPSSSSSSSSAVKAEQDEASHFARVFPLHELVAARPKTEFETVAMKQLQPITLEKANKYIDGKLDPALAARAIMTEVNGKGVACVSGRIAVQNHEFVVEPLERPDGIISRGLPFSSDAAAQQSLWKNDPKARVTGAKRKAPAIGAAGTFSPSGSVISDRTIEYREKSSVLLGQVDEDKLLEQLKAHDAHLDVYVSQGPNNADAMLTIPALDARVTLWREDAKTLIETPKEDARALLQGMVLAQLHELPV